MRSTFAQLEKFTYRLGAAAALLGISENTLRLYIKDSGIEISRQPSTNLGAPQVRQFSLDNVFQLSAWRGKKHKVKVEPLMPIFIMIGSMKTSTGKSTTATELGVQLQLSGFRVLMIDLDPEGKLTQYMGYEPDLESHEAITNSLSSEAIVRGTFFDACKGYFIPGNCHVAQKENIERYIKWPFGTYGPALIPADPFISNFEHAAADRENTAELVFPTFFQDAAEGKVPGLRVTNFDIVLFDCPPAKNFIVSNVLAIADYVVAPVSLDSFAGKGIKQMVKEIEGSKCNYSRIPELIFLPTFRSDFDQKALRMWNKLHVYKKKLTSISISASPLFSASQKLYTPLTIRLPKSVPAAEYRNLTNFLI